MRQVVDEEFWGLNERYPTTYKVATTDDDYADCMDLIADMGWPKKYELCHPTIMAIRDGELFGLIGTRLPNGEILAGPLAVKDGPKPVMVWRLLLEYERACKSLGWDSVAFDVDIGSAMELAILRLTPNIPLIAELDNVRLYEWTFDMVEPAE